MSTRWTNWAGEQVCAPQEIVRPTNEEQLAEHVARAAKRKQHAGDAARGQ